MKVDIGIPVYGTQHHEWTFTMLAELMSYAQADVGVKIGNIHHVASALPDHNKNKIVDDRTGIASRWEREPHRPEQTDMNRSVIAGGFLSGDAEWLWMLDDDVVPPDGALGHLLGLGHVLVGGVCHLGNPPYNVCAYFKDPKTGYYTDAVGDFLPGAIIKVDSIGMGCTLIHRSVFEKIMETHVVYERPTGSLMPIPKRIIKDHKLAGPNAESRVENGYLHMPLRMVDPNETRAWPFFSMEYGRTEDHPFCEMAVEAGIYPRLDTTVMCEHLKMKPISRKSQREAKTLERLEAQARANGNG